MNEEIVPADVANPLGKCADAQFHGNPYRYCACGWMEAEALQEPTTVLPPLYEVRVLDDGVEEHEVIPIRYQVEVYAIGADPVFTTTTYGNWGVEGNFLIT